MSFMKKILMVLVLAEQQEPPVAGLPRLQLEHGVDRVAGARALDFAGLQVKARHAGDRQAQHLGTLRRRREHARLLPWRTGGDPAQLVERQRFEGAARQCQVRVVDRIEASAEDEYPHSRILQNGEAGRCRPAG